MKKTSNVSHLSCSCNSQILPTLLWESLGVYYPFVSGYRLIQLRGNQLLSPSQKPLTCNLHPDEAVSFKVSGWRLIWDNPPEDLVISLSHLWDVLTSEGIVRLWVLKKKSRYEGFWVQGVFSQSWPFQIFLSGKPFSVTFWR